MNLDNLTRFGSSFQIKCLVALLTDRVFCEQVRDIVNPKYFESESQQWIAERFLWYLQEYKSIPTIDVFGKESIKLEDESVKSGIKSSLLEVYKLIKTPPDDLSYIKDEFLEFCKNQELKNAILKSAELLSDGRYLEIKGIIDKAMNAGQERNIGHMWNDEIDRRVNKMARNTIPTPWDCINVALDGGLGGGELGCIIAPSGIGKSWLLAKIGNHAIRLGKRVVYYTLELSEDYVGLRHDTILTGIETREIKNNYSVVKEAVESVPGELIIKYFPARQLAVNGISSHLNRMIQLGSKPDLVIVDYADLMFSMARAQAKHEELGYIYEELRGLLGEFNIPGWTASQSQRSSLQDEVIGADKIAGAYAKVMTCDVVMSASRKLEDKFANTGRVHMIKNRFGPDGQVYPAVMDLAHGYIEIYDEDSMEGSRLKDRMENGRDKITSILKQKMLERNDD